MAEVTLFDLVPPTEIVTINGVDHKVRGLPLRIVTELVHEYPALISFLSGGGLTAEAILEQGPKAISTIIAAGYGMPGNDKAMAAAADLPLDVQLDLIAGIVKATMGGGTGPFAEKVKRLYQNFGMATGQEKERADNLETAKRKLAELRSKSQQDSNSSRPEVATVN